LESSLKGHSLGNIKGLVAVPVKGIVAVPGHMVANNVNKLREKIRRLKGLPDPTERRRLRIMAGLSLQDVATSVGVTRSAISRWELGSRSPHQSNLGPYVAVLTVISEELRETPDD